MRDDKSRLGVLGVATAVFAAAVLFNFPWELAQSPLYQDQAALSTRVWHCFVASLGDGVMVLMIWSIGWYAFQSPVWFDQRQVAVYALMLLLGFLVAMVVEELGLAVGRWRYTSRMPLLGHLGLVPLLQMLVLPPLIFATVARTRRHLRKDAV